MSISVLQREKELRHIQAKLAEKGFSGPLSALSKENYSEELTSLLIDLFGRLADPMVRLEIARKLALSSDRSAVEELLLAAFEEGASSDLPAWESYKWGLAGILESIASRKSARTLHYLKIAKSKEYGRNREMIVLALAKLSGSEVEDVLIRLLGDDEVYGHAIIALGKRRVQRALPLLMQFKTDHKAWVRKEASNAIARIEKGRR